MCRTDGNDPLARLHGHNGKFLFRGVFAHRVGKPPTYGGGGPRSGGEGGLQLYNAVFVMYVYHAPTVTPLARHLPREWEALSNTAKQEFICINSVGK